MRGWINQQAERAVRRALGTLQRGRLDVVTAEGTHTYGDRAAPPVVLVVHHPRFFQRILTGGDIGLGESFVDGDWSTPDLVALVRLMLANAETLTALTGDRRPCRARS
ncbi:MAG TPA: hypothetical protein VNJ02_15595 [Vicinamibacterales bacterium]|nr:hypothetical protein [Vicinamibacterales bacterium]